MRKQKTPKGLRYMKNRIEGADDSAPSSFRRGGPVFERLRSRTMRLLRSQRWTPHVVGAAVLVIAGFSLTCAGARGPIGSGPVATRPATPEEKTLERDASQVYQQAQERFEEANYAVAESLANKIIADYGTTEWRGPALLLSARAAFELNQAATARARAGEYLTLYRAFDRRRTPALILIARTHHLEGRPGEAADSLLAIPGIGRDEREEAAQLARLVVAELGVGEIEAIIARWPQDHALRSVFEVERASLLLAAGRPSEAREAAGQALELDPLEADRRRAQNIAAGEVETEQWRPIVGAILPMSGQLAAYGRMAEEGIRLAIEEYNRRHFDEVTLVIRDDADRYERDADLARELERLGAVAIVGPLRAEGLELAAKGRRDRDLLIVSPTALENLSFARNTFSVWGVTERVTQDARALAAFAVRDLQVYRFAVMYPGTLEGRMQLAAFSDAVQARGGTVVASLAYEDTATTFDLPLAYLKELRPQAIYAPASSPESVIQLAPQFSYYGLRGVQVLGDAEWSAPKVLRLVEPRFINGTVISTFLDRTSPSVRWSEFVEMYERKYRKGVDDSLVPALAYDATRLILSALPWGYPRRSAVARSFAEIRSLPGATGVFTVDNGTITRRPFLLQFKDRELIPAYDEFRAERTGSEWEFRR